MEDKESPLSSLKKSWIQNLLSTVRSDVERGHKDLDSIEAEIANSVQRGLLELLPEKLQEILLKRAPAVLSEHRTADSGFELRNFQRWRKAFDALETMVAIAEEIGELCDTEERETAGAENDYRFEALSHLFPRALLVTREIICLLKGGYPDGALSRWRSLHELTVTAMFLVEQDDAIALRYLANFHLQALRAAKQFNRYADRAHLQPFSAAEMAKIEMRWAAASSEIGGEMKGDWGWAAPVLTKESPTFADIEKAVTMDHWRPRYKWASQHIHSSHRPGESLLGASEARQPVTIVGRSNSGFVDPLHMTAISLSQIALTFLLKNPNVDRVVYSKVLVIMADNVGSLAIESESTSLEQWLKEEEVRKTLNEEVMPYTEP